MKKIHLLQTDKQSRLILQGSELLLSKYKEKNEGFSEFNQHIYITSDEEIKEGDWMYYKHFGEDIICKYDTLGGQNTNVNEHKDYYKKIILTTDQDLIKDGVQSIDDDFLEWFVKNPSCEEVDTIIEYKDGYGNWFKYDKEFWDKMGNKPKFGTRYKIIIPSEEPKQETLEEASWKAIGTKEDTFYDGAKWQQEQDKNKYSEQEVRTIAKDAYSMGRNNILIGVFNKWFEQFKKK